MLEADISVWSGFEAMEFGDKTEVVERQTEGPSKAVWREWIVAATAVSALIADQVTKYLVRENMAIGESWPAEGFFRLTHGTNTGSAFGLFQDQTTVLTIASVFAIGFIVYFYRSHSDRSWITKVHGRPSSRRRGRQSDRQAGSGKGHRLY